MDKSAGTDKYVRLLLLFAAILVVSLMLAYPYLKHLPLYSLLSAGVKTTTIFESKTAKEGVGNASVTSSAGAVETQGLCGKCLVDNVQCPKTVSVKDVFQVNYSILGTYEQYEIQVIKVNNTLKCFNNQDIPDCVRHNATVKLMCPSGGANSLYNVTVSCFASKFSDDVLCNEVPNDLKSCEILCKAS